VSETVSVNLVPHSLADALKGLYDKTSDERYFLRTLHSAFYLYRRCVISNFLAVLTKNGSVWEWPEPAAFSWGDINRVNFIGTMVGAMGNDDRRMEKSVNIIDNPVKNFKFRVNKLADVRVINSSMWQDVTRKIYMADVVQALDRGADKTKSKQLVETLINKFLEMKVDLPTGRYAKTGETPNNSFLLTL
jgi:hypothetical protein